MTIWQVLGIEATTDLKIIKQAYAIKLKENKPEVNPAGFQLVRKAYESALEHAAGKRVNFELSEEGQGSKDEREQSEDHPGARVVKLLDLLDIDEEKAIQQLEHYQEERIFDDLEYRESFENTLIVNLLSQPIPHPLFMLYIIKFFNWSRENINLKKDAYARLALINLLNRVEPYRFLTMIKNLKSIQNRKAASAINVKWSECSAAKVLDNPPNFFTFFYYLFFNSKIKSSIYALVEHVTKNYPQLIGSGLNLYSFAWWHKRFQKYKNGDNLYATLGLYFVFFLMMAASAFRNDHHYTRPNQATKQSHQNVYKNTVHHNSYSLDMTDNTFHQLSKSLGLDEINGKN